MQGRVRNLYTLCQARSFTCGPSLYTGSHLQQDYYWPQIKDKSHHYLCCQGSSHFGSTFSWIIRLTSKYFLQLPLIFNPVITWKGTKGGPNRHMLNKVWVTYGKSLPVGHIWEQVIGQNGDGHCKVEKSEICSPLNKGVPSSCPLALLAFLLSCCWA